MSTEQAVIIRCALPERADRSLDSLGDLEKMLTHVIESKTLGEYDGNEMGQGELVLYFYGPSAESLFEAIVPTLRSSKLMTSAVITIRHGEPGAPCRVVTLS